ncbi:MAG: hypothetical protein KDA65_11505 [Planctomycetaceae bacterium]|nr:hypothetical protein [Planctomycetaceae bacterium]
MKAFKTLALVAVAGCVFAGAEAAQAGPLDFLNPFSWGNQNYYSNPSFSTGTVCGPNGCYPSTNCANGQCSPTYSTYRTNSTNCVNGQCYPAYSQPYGSTYAVPSSTYSGASNCPGGICPPTTNYYRMPSTSSTTPVYYPPATNSYSSPVIQPVSGNYSQPSMNTNQVNSPFYN